MIARLLNELESRVRTLPSGAKSLAHVRVLVPTAQAGRRLRRRLAERYGALVPPTVKTPMTLRLDETDTSLATRTDEIAAFRAAIVANRTAKDEPSDRVALLRAKELADLRALLLPGPFAFADVAEKLAADLPEEAERWRELATLEKAYLAELEKRGKRDRIAALQAGVPVDPEIEETLDWSDIAAHARAHDPKKPLIARSRILPTATPSDEAARIAAYFAAVGEGEELPALCVADPALFPEIETAFKARGLRIHNPAETPLVASSLGRLVAQVVALLEHGSYAVFSSFVRGGDVRRWLKRELGLTDETLTAALVDLDNRQAEFLPEKIDDIAPKTKGTLRAIFEFVKVQFRKKTLRQVLGAIFKDLVLDERNPEAREFVAAAEVVSELIEECRVPGKDGAPDGLERDLFALRLEESSYSLEPDEGDVLLTDGWLELPFVETGELVIAGFREGCVPESTVGHPYLPDSLRHRLGLPDNAAKEARDRAILAMAVDTRAANAVTVFFHTIDEKGDVLKPSRLLFETPDDADLAARVKALYGRRPGTAESSASDLPSAWKLALPIPPPHQELLKISPTRLDGYLRCPFTYCLKDKAVLGDKRMDDRAEELASWEYGNLAHEALEAFALSDLKDATDPAVIRAFLDEQVDRQLVARFATAIPAIVGLQGESVKRRLANFAVIQAARRAAGWRIVAAERKLTVTYGHTVFHGKCDRIDYHDATGRWCVIDYKTWDTAAKAKCFDERTGAWLSLQLPLYCAMLDADSSEEFAAATRERITSCYCVLGKTKDHVVFTEETSAARVPEAENEARRLVRRIEYGLFWPPGPQDEWKYDYEDWLAPSPEETVGEAWIADQNARRERFEEEGEA